MEDSLKNVYFTTLAIDFYVPIFDDFPECTFILLNCFQYLTENDSIEIYAFVIMRDHLHVVWKIADPLTIDEIITKFKKYTGSEIRKYFKHINKEYLQFFESSRTDRKHKIWKTSKGNLQIQSSEILTSKVRYIHNNPTKGNYKVVDDCSSYSFSSAKTYSKKSSNFRCLTILEDIAPWC